MKRSFIKHDNPLVPFKGLSVPASAHIPVEEIRRVETAPPLFSTRIWSNVKRSLSNKEVHIFISIHAQSTYVYAFKISSRMRVELIQLRATKAIFHVTWSKQFQTLLPLAKLPITTVNSFSTSECL